jgi:hypothetical protein
MHEQLSQHSVREEDGQRRRQQAQDELEQLRLERAQLVLQTETLQVELQSIRQQQQVAKDSKDEDARSGISANSLQQLQRHSRTAVFPSTPVLTVSSDGSSGSIASSAETTILHHSATTPLASLSCDESICSPPPVLNALLGQLQKQQQQHEHELQHKDTRLQELLAQVESLQQQLHALQGRYETAITCHHQAAASASASAEKLESASRAVAEQRAKRKSDRAAYAHVVQQYKIKFDALMEERDRAIAAAACIGGIEGEGATWAKKVMDLELKALQVRDMCHVTFAVACEAPM